MKVAFYPVVLLICLGAIACSDTAKSEDNGHVLLINCWKHVHEEDTGGNVQLFKPCDAQDYPPSHYRNTLILKPGDQSEYLKLSPVDAHTMENGTWHYNSETKTLEIHAADGTLAGKYIVEEIHKDKLLLRPVN